MACLVILAVLLSECSGCREQAAEDQPRGPAAVWPLPPEYRPEGHPVFYPMPGGDGSFTWLSEREIAFSSRSGVSVLNVSDGSLRSLPVNAYLLSGDGRSRLAFATTAGLGVAGGNNIRTVLPRAEVDRAIGAPPGYAMPPGDPADYFRDPAIMLKWQESFISVVEGLSWSPTGNYLAVLVQAHSLASLVVVRSAVLVVDPSGGAPPRVVVTRDAAEGKIRWVNWLDDDTLLVFHNDYLEPDSDEGWAYEPPDPPPTASFTAVNLSPGAGPRILLRLPWHSRVAASGPGGLVAVVQQPRGPRVDPEGAILQLPEGKVPAPVLEDLLWWGVVLRSSLLSSHSVSYANWRAPGRTLRPPFGGA